MTLEHQHSRKEDAAPVTELACIKAQEKCWRRIFSYVWPVVIFLGSVSVSSILYTYSIQCAFASSKMEMAASVARIDATMSNFSESVERRQKQIIDKIDELKKAKP